MPGGDVNLSSNVARPAGLAVGDALARQARSGRMGERALVALGGAGARHHIADEGSYWRVGSLLSEAVTAGGGTRFTSMGRVAWTSGADYMLLNTEALGGRRVYLDYFRILTSFTGVNGSPTSAQFSCAIDPDPAALPAPSTGSTNATTNATEMQWTGDSALGLPAVLLGPQAFGSAGFAATTTTRAVARTSLRQTNTGVNGPWDEWIVSFGGRHQDGFAIPDVAGKRTATNVPPVVIGPGAAAFFSLWFPGGVANTNTVGEFELGFWAR